MQFSSGLALQQHSSRTAASCYSRDPHSALRTAAPALRLILFDANTLKHSGNSISDLRNRRQKVAAEIWCYSFRPNRALQCASMRPGVDRTLKTRLHSSGAQKVVLWRQQPVTGGLVDLNPGGTSIPIDS